jgi:ABC-type hemin transport system ATPase subunit
MASLSRSEGGRPLVRIADGAVDLGGRRVLSGVQLRVEAGSFLGLVGPGRPRSCD